jgi:L-amino acid N-acyltransferase YncA
MIDRLIRAVQETDLAAIVAIYNDVIQTSFIIWREEPTSVAERREWLAESSTMGYPTLVAIDASVHGQLPGNLGALP